MNIILQLFPPHIKQALDSHLQGRWSQLEEIRLRIGRPIECIFTNKVHWLEQIILSEKDCFYVINQLSEHSLYRFEDELKEGYITVKGGHRVGLAGNVVLENGVVHRIHFITFLNIRIAKEKIGIAKHLVKLLCNDEQLHHTLIVGAPQSGKTTVLRDIARIVSNGESSLPAKKVAIIDERSEIAACYNGIPQHDVGKRTDVMDACPKAEGMMMMIRSMSPEVMIVDEIGKESDVHALLDALHAGVTVICSVHGHSIAEVKKRYLLRKLFELNIFQRYVLLQKTTKQFTYEVENEHQQRIEKMW